MELSKVDHPVSNGKAPNQDSGRVVNIGQNVVSSAKVDTVDVKDLQSSVAAIKDFLKDNPRMRFNVQINETLNRPVVSITDTNGREVRQIPFEEVVAVAENIELMKGILFDQKI